MLWWGLLDCFDEGMSKARAILCIGFLGCERVVGGGIVGYLASVMP